MSLWKYKKAFTLAEVLITLGIIGVVAAITIPGLITKYQKLATVVKLKKVYSQLNQEQKDDYCEIQLKIVEEIVTNPKAFFSYRIFSAGSMLAIKGVK